MRHGNLPRPGGVYLGLSNDDVNDNAAWDNKGGPDKLSPATVSAANSWDVGVTTPAFKPTG